MTRRIATFRPRKGHDCTLAYEKRCYGCTKRDTQFTPLLFSQAGQKFHLSHMIFMIYLAFRLHSAVYAIFVGKFTGVCELDGHEYGAFLKLHHSQRAGHSVVADRASQKAPQAPRSWPSSSQTPVNWPTKLRYVMVCHLVSR